VTRDWGQRHHRSPGKSDVEAEWALSRFSAQSVTSVQISARAVAADRDRVGRRILSTAVEESP